MKFELLSEDSKINISVTDINTSAINLRVLKRELNHYFIALNINGDIKKMKLIDCFNHYVNLGKSEYCDMLYLLNNLAVFTLKDYLECTNCDTTDVRFGNLLFTNHKNCIESITKTYTYVLEKYNHKLTIEECSNIEYYASFHGIDFLCKVYDKEIRYLLDKINNDKLYNRSIGNLIYELFYYDSELQRYKTKEKIETYILDLTDTAIFVRERMKLEIEGYEPIHQVITGGYKYH